MRNNETIISFLLLGRRGRQLLLGLAIIGGLLVTGTDSFVARQRKNNHSRSRSGGGFAETAVRDKAVDDNKKTFSWLSSFVRPRTAMCLRQSNNDDDDSDGDNFTIQTWNPLRLLVLRLGMTEPMATSPFNYGKYNGDFTCAYCGQTLFESSAKYDSKSGWPSFWRSANEKALSYKLELDGRLECKCQKCNSHLGHVFLDGPTPASVDPVVLQASPDSDPRSNSGKYLPRFCINGAALNYREKATTAAATTAAAAAASESE